MESRALALEISFLGYWGKFIAALHCRLIFICIKIHSVVIWSANRTFLIKTLIYITTNE